MKSRASRISALMNEEKRERKPMLTVAQLRQYASQMSQGEMRPVSILSTNPILQNKTITIKGEARGTKLYPITVVFYNVDYSLEPDATHPFKVRPKVGDPFWMSPLSEATNPIQVRCTCKRFEFAFAHWNRKEKALSGPAFPPYIRKTTTRPEVNPSQIPGACKHLIAFFNRLNRDKILS